MIFKKKLFFQFKNVTDIWTVNKLVGVRTHDIFLGMKGTQREEKIVLAMAFCEVTTCKHTSLPKHPKPKKLISENSNRSYLGISPFISYGLDYIFVLNALKFYF